MSEYRLQWDKVTDCGDLKATVTRQSFGVLRRTWQVVIMPNGSEALAYIECPNGQVFWAERRLESITAAKRWARRELGRLGA